MQVLMVSGIELLLSTIVKSADAVVKRKIQQSKTGCDTFKQVLTKKDLLPTGLLPAIFQKIAKRSSAMLKTHRPAEVAQFNQMATVFLQQLDIVKNLMTEKSKITVILHGDDKFITTNYLMIEVIDSQSKCKKMEFSLHDL